MMLSELQPKDRLPCIPFCRPRGGKVTKAENIEEVICCAQALFAERGYEAISLREIAQFAQVGLGTINFYFGSKESLFSAVVVRTVREINAHRMAILSQCEQKHPDGTPKLHQVLRAVIWPIVSRAASSDLMERSVPHLIRWALVGPPAVEATLRREFDKVSERLLSAILLACPGISRENAVWGFSATIAILYSRQVLDDRYAHFLDRTITSARTETAHARCDRLVLFLAAGFIGLRPTIND
jgi:AcrR family transcriptional regulator